MPSPIAFPVQAKDFGLGKSCAHFPPRKKKAQLQSHGGWKAAAARKARESHGDRVAAAPLRVGLQIPWRSARLLPASKETRQAASSPAFPCPRLFFTASCCCFLLWGLGSWPPPHARNRPSSSSPACPGRLVSLAAFVLLCFLLCSCIE